METRIRADVNFIKKDWGLFFEFSMAAEQMDPNDKNNQYLDHGSETSQLHRPEILEMGIPEIG